MLLNIRESIFRQTVSLSKNDLTITKGSSWIVNDIDCSSNIYFTHTPSHMMSRLSYFFPAGK